MIILVKIIAWIDAIRCCGLKAKPCMNDYINAAFTVYLRGGRRAKELNQVLRRLEREYERKNPRNSGC